MKDAIWTGLGAAVLGVLIGGCVASADIRTDQGQAADARRIALYKKIAPSDIAWGRESDPAGEVGVIDPPYCTPNRDRVEIVEFVSYTTTTWKRSVPHARAWEASLPEIIKVRRQIDGTAGNKDHPWVNRWLLHQKLLSAAEVLGREEAVHHAIYEQVQGKRGHLGVDVGALATVVGLDPGVYARRLGDPEVAWRARASSGVDSDFVRAGQGLWPAGAVAIYPEFLIDGRYLLSASITGDPARTYRMANRLIREALESDRSADDCPENDAEFAAWLAPRAGQVLDKVKFGKGRRGARVYSHDRRETWVLGDDGEVVAVYRLRGEGADSHWALQWHKEGRNDPQWASGWRIARQFMAYAGEAGAPQRYGAFLLTDWLSAPETLWVGLPFKGHEVALAFTPDGKVEARNDTGSLFGTWWLEAGNLNVSFGELGLQSWPWREAAKHVGFEVPQRALTPWRFEKQGSAKWRPAAGTGDGQ